MTLNKAKASGYEISNIKIKGNVMSWEGRSIYLPAITQIWIGPGPARPFPASLFLVLLFIGLSGRNTHMLIIAAALLAALWALRFHLLRQGKGDQRVVIQLSTGETATFTAQSLESRVRFYNALKEALEGPGACETSFGQDGGIVEQVGAPCSLVEASEKHSRNQPLARDLQKLYLSCSKKADGNGEILGLIKEAADFLEWDDRQGLKEACKKFVLSGLVSDCNELGLDALLQEIKSSLF